MYTKSFRAVTLFTVLLLGVCALFCGCGTNTQLASAGTGVDGSTIDPAGTGSDTLLATVADPEFGTYELLAQSGDQRSGKWNFLVRATRSGTKPQLRFVWDFGNGPEGEGTQQVHTFTADGSYLIKVSALQTDGSVAFVLKLTIEVSVDPNRAPIAVAGPDLSANENDLVFLYGGDSNDPNGDPITYSWTQTFGPAVGILHAAEPSASFVVPLVDVDTDLVFRLTVGDGSLTGHDDVIVHAKPLLDPSGIGLQVSAGPDQQVAPGATISLSGSATPTNSGIVYAWNQFQGPNLTITNANLATASFVAPAIAPGATVVFGFELVATWKSAVATDEVFVTVVGGTVPPDPCAVAVNADGDRANDCVPGCPPFVGCDECPNDPKKGAPGICGCGIADTDAGGDGTADCLQQLLLLHLDGNTSNSSTASIVESWGNAADGTWVGTPAYVGDGVSGQAASFDGTSYVSLPNTTGLAVFDKFTIAAWVRFDTLSPTAAYSVILDTAAGSSPRTGYTLFYQRSNGVIRLELWNAGAVTFAMDSAKTTWSINNTWYHIAVVFDSNGFLEDGNTGRLYVDGVLDSSSGWRGGLGSGVSATGQVGRYFQGDLDEVTVWDRALTQAEVQALAAADSSSPTLAVAPTSLDFGAATNSLTFEVWANGGSLGYMVADDATWLSVSPTSGTSTGEHDTITATVNRTGLASGSYTGQMTVTLADGSSPITVVVAITVAAAAAPLLAVAPMSLDFGSTTTSLTFEVWNSGTGTLTYGLSDDAAWLSVSPMSGTSTGEHDTITATASRSGLAAGSHTGHITITPAGGGSPVTVAVAISVAAAATPSLAVAPLSLDFGSTTTSLTFEVWNSGTGTLNFTITENISWLTCTPISGSSTGEHDTITCTVDRSGLPAGIYGPAPISVSGASTTTNIYATMSVSAGGALPMSTASRTSGVAPLAVFFDAVDPANGVVKPGDGDYALPYYKWDFGDSTSGTWATNGKSKNSATGYVAAHVYENPGSYTVALRVMAPSGQAYDYQQTITVASNNTLATYCFSTSGNFTGCPSGTLAANQITTSNLLDIDNRLGTNRRLLLRRGESWTAATGLGLGDDGPGILGAYGTGVNPRITITGRGSGIAVRGQDWRILDVDLVGPGDGNSDASGIEGATVPGSVNLLVLRAEISKFRVGIGWSQWQNYLHDKNFIVDSHVHDIEVNGLFVGSSRLAILGTVVEDISGSHGARVWQSSKGVISHSRIRNPGGNRPCLKFHGNNHDSGLPETQYTVISDNSFIHGLQSGEDFGAVASLEPENSSSDQRVSHILFVRNVLYATNKTAIQLEIHARYVTAYNNVFIGNLGTRYLTAVDISLRGIEPAPLGNRVYNNTAYSSNSGVAEWEFCRISNDSTDTIVRSNLASAPVAPNPQLVVGGGVGLIQDHNLLTSLPGFLDAAAENFRLQGVSVAVDAGYYTGIPFDSDGNPRSDALGRSNTGEGTLKFSDIGAFEYQGP